MIYGLLWGLAIVLVYHAWVKRFDSGESETQPRSERRKVSSRMLYIASFALVLVPALRLVLYGLADYWGLYELSEEAMAQIAASPNGTVVTYEEPSVQGLVGLWVPILMWWPVTLFLCASASFVFVFVFKNIKLSAYPVVAAGSAVALTVGATCYFSLAYLILRPTLISNLFLW